MLERITPNYNSWSFFYNYKFKSLVKLQKLNFNSLQLLSWGDQIKYNFYTTDIIKINSFFKQLYKSYIFYIADVKDLVNYEFLTLDKILLDTSLYKNIIRLKEYLHFNYKTNYKNLNLFFQNQEFIENYFKEIENLFNKKNSIKYNWNEALESKISSYIPFSSLLKKKEGDVNKLMSDFEEKKKFISRYRIENEELEILDFYDNLKSFNYDYKEHIRPIYNELENSPNIYFFNKNSTNFKFKYIGLKTELIKLKILNQKFLKIFSKTPNVEIKKLQNTNENLFANILLNNNKFSWNSFYLQILKLKKQTSELVLNRAYKSFTTWKKFEDSAIDYVHFFNKDDFVILNTRFIPYIYSSFSFFFFKPLGSFETTIKDLIFSWKWRDLIATYSLKIYAYWYKLNLNNIIQYQYMKAYNIYKYYRYNHTFWIDMEMYYPTYEDSLRDYFEKPANHKYYNNEFFYFILKSVNKLKVVSFKSLIKYNYFNYYDTLELIEYSDDLDEYLKFKFMKNYYNDVKYHDYLDFIEDFDHSDMQMVEAVEYDRLLLEYKKLYNMNKFTINITNKDAEGIYNPDFYDLKEYVYTNAYEYNEERNEIIIRNLNPYGEYDLFDVESYDNFLFGNFSNNYYNNFFKFKSVFFDLNEIQYNFFFYLTCSFNLVFYSFLYIYIFQVKNYKFIKII